MSLLTFYKRVLKLNKWVRRIVMTKIAFKFDPKKAIESILYLAPKVSDPDVYGICKLLYLADKTSLEKYGRFIFGETYVAMKEGATPSNAYNLIKPDAEISELKLDGYNVIPLRDADLDYLSESDIECLDKIIANYGNVPNWRRGEDAHDGAWSVAWKNRGNRDSVPIPIETIAELLEDSEDLIDYLANVG